MSADLVPFEILDLILTGWIRGAIMPSHIIVLT